MGATGNGQARDHCKQGYYVSCNPAAAAEHSNWRACMPRPGKRGRCLHNEQHTLCRSARLLMAHMTPKHKTNLAYRPSAACSACRQASCRRSSMHAKEPGYLAGYVLRSPALQHARHTAGKAADAEDHSHNNLTACKASGIGCKPAHHLRSPALGKCSAVLLLLHSMRGGVTWTFATAKRNQKPAGRVAEKRENREATASNHQSCLRMRKAGPKPGQHTTPARSRVQQLGT